jgi:hypothetical protein
MKKDTKQCPTCSVPIHRIEGCSQMYCIKCHTAFDWNTGKIDKGYIHNPEYFRYQRENILAIPPNPYGGCNENDVNWYAIQQLIYHKKYNNKFFDRIFDITASYYRSFGHVQQQLAHLPRNLGDVDNIDLSIRYMKNEIHEKQWKKLLKGRVKRTERQCEIYLVLDMYKNVVKDIFRNFIRERTISCEDLLCQLKRIYDYSNEQIEKINQKYGSEDKSIYIYVSNQNQNLIS